MADGLGLWIPGLKYTKAASTAMLTSSTRLSHKRDFMVLATTSRAPPPRPDEQPSGDQQQRQCKQKAQADQSLVSMRQGQGPVRRRLGIDVDEAVIVGKPVEDIETEHQIAAVIKIGVGKKIPVAGHDST